MSKPNTLFYGDCLDILKNRDQSGDRYIKDESVDLIYLDPPFNSDRVYNVIFKEPNGRAAASQIKGFDDTWTWNDNVAEEYEDIKEAGGKVAETLVGLEMILGFCNMFAYLVMMASRLVEMRRVLKSTGSIYLHCDQTAGHYIKVLMDAVFGGDNFGNDIIWSYTKVGGTKKKFMKSHDMIFRYTKGKKFVFNMDDVREPYSDSIIKSLKKDDGGLYYTRGLGTDKNMNRIKKTYVHPNGRVPGDVWVIPWTLGGKERLGYPTQKPEALLERIIKVSSNPGDVVLDPFSGCGSCVSVAQRLDRKWIGIDITHIAITIMKHRLGPDADYQVIGEPASLEDAQQLAKEDPFQFQLWALGLVKARPEGGMKKGKDQGIDGKYFFETPTKTETIIYSVKAGRVLPRDVRDLNGTVNANKAAIGVLISMEGFTKDMRSEAAKGGFYKPKGVIGEETYPRIQLYTIEDLLGGEKIKYPIYLKDVTLPDMRKSTRMVDGDREERELSRWE